MQDEAWKHGARVLASPDLEHIEENTPESAIAQIPGVSIAGTKTNPTEPRGKPGITHKPLRATLQNHRKAHGPPAGVGYTCSTLENLINEAPCPALAVSNK